MADSHKKRWLDDATLEALYDAAVGADLVGRGTRAVLLQGLSDAVRLALPDHERPDVQFRSDLRQLAVPRPDGRVPLRAWLAEARALAVGRPEEAVFAAALARPDPVSGGADGGDGAGDGGGAGEGGGVVNGSAGEGGAAVNGGRGEGGNAVNGERGEGAGIVNGSEGGGDNPVNGHARGEGGPLNDRAGLSGGGGNSVNGSAGGGGAAVIGGEGESAAVNGSAGGGSSGGGGSVDRRWWAAAGVAAVGVVAAVGIGIGSGDPPEPDAGLADAHLDAGFVEPRLDAALADGHLDALVDAALADAALPPVDFPTGGPFASATPARPALRRVPAGRLRFDDGFGAVRALTVARAIAMSDTPVSRAQYEEVMGVAPPVPTSDGIDPRPVRVTPQDPATGITVAQARAYCDALSRSEGRTPHYANPGKTVNGYRLPDEAAWVMACTAGRAPTAALAEHPWGVAPGERVREWVDDRFSRPGSTGPVVAPGAGQAVRGGGRRQGAELRCLDRIEIAGGQSGPVVGFRVMRPLAATER